MKKTILLLIIVATILVSACTENLTEEELAQKIFEANSNMDSYTAEMIMTMNMKTSIIGNPIDMNSITTSKGDIDRLNKKAKIKSSIKAEEMGINIQTDSYVIDNFIYVKSMGNWIKMELNEDLWTQQDQVEQVTTLMDSGIIENLGEEKLNGESYYKVKITPDIKKMFEVSLKQENLFSNYESMNYEDMVKSYSMTIWVNKKSYIIEKTRTEMNLLMTSDNIGEEDPEKELESNIEMSTIIDVIISNINEEPDIVLPSEANDAIDYNEMFQDLKTPRITGNIAYVR